jgi:hypothetical protein
MPEDVSELSSEATSFLIMSHKQHVGEGDAPLICDAGGPPQPHRAKADSIIDVVHPTRGVGQVVDYKPGSRKPFTVAYASGEKHRYSVASSAKLAPQTVPAEDVTAGVAAGPHALRMHYKVDAIRPGSVIPKPGSYSLPFKAGMLTNSGATALMSSHPRNKLRRRGVGPDAAPTVLVNRWPLYSCYATYSRYRVCIAVTKPHLQR